MKSNTNTSITDLRPCAPSFIPHVDGTHHVTAPLTVVLLILATSAWIASVRLDNNGRPGWATAADVAAALLLILGLACGAVWGLTFTC